MGLKMKELIKEIREFARERDWDQFHSPKNLAMALIVEVSEIVEHFQWLTEEQSRNLSSKQIEEIKDEIADVLIYLMNFTDKLGVDPTSAVKEKIKKNRIKYPIEKAKGTAKKYTQF
jgi:dCTP diphosphatase